ncbi:MAG: hypothetical protein AB1921_10460 [Thermodesulfobacteriota bacterium]
MKIKALLLASLLLPALGLFPAFGAEQGTGADKIIPAAARFSEPAVPLGQAANLCLSFTLPEGAELVTPVRPEGLGDNELLGVSREKDGVCLKILAASLESLHVPSVSLACRAKDGGLLTVQSEPAALSVTASLPQNPEKAAARPLSGLLEVTASWKKALPWVAGGLAALGLLLGGLLFLRRRLDRSVMEVVAQRPAHEVALDGLSGLSRALERQEIEEKPFYFTLTQIVREYMGAIRGFPAAEMTTQEIAARTADDQDRSMLPLLREADMVKFAKKPATRSSMEEHLVKARGYVQATMPRLTEQAQ